MGSKADSRADSGSDPVGAEQEQQRLEKGAYESFLSDTDLVLGKLLSWKVCVRQWLEDVANYEDADSSLKLDLKAMEAAAVEPCLTDLIHLRCHLVARQNGDGRVKGICQRIRDYTGFAVALGDWIEKLKPTIQAFISRSTDSKPDVRSVRIGATVQYWSCTQNKWKTTEVEGIKLKCCRKLITSRDADKLVTSRDAYNPQRHALDDERTVEAVASSSVESGNGRRGLRRKANCSEGCVSGVYSKKHKATHDANEAEAATDGYTALRLMSYRDLVKLCNEFQPNWNPSNYSKVALVTALVDCQEGLAAQFAPLPEELCPDEEHQTTLQEKETRLGARLEELDEVAQIQDVTARSLEEEERHRRGAWERLVDIFGEQTARKLVEQNRAVIKSSAETIRGAWGSLADILGEQIARKVVERSPGVLRSPAETIRGAWGSLADILGEQIARKIVERNPDVLRAPAETIRGAWGCLADILGEQIARKVVERNPGVLRSPAETIRGAWGSLADILGEQIAHKFVERNPDVLKAPADTIRGAWEELIKIVGLQTAGELAMSYPYVFRARAKTIRSCWELMVKMFGEEEALRRVSTRPCMLCGISNVSKVKTSSIPAAEAEEKKCEEKADCFGRSKTLAPELSGVSGVFGQPQLSATAGVSALQNCGSSTDESLTSRAPMQSYQKSKQSDGSPYRTASPSPGHPDFRVMSAEADRDESEISESPVRYPRDSMLDIISESDIASIDSELQSDGSPTSSSA